MGVANIELYKPVAVRLSENSRVQRSLPPHKLWGDREQPLSKSELESFDARTIFYDVALSLDAARILAIGPPLGNLDEELLPIECHILDDSGEPVAQLKSRIQRFRMGTVMSLRLPQKWRGQPELSMRMDFADSTRRDLTVRRPPTATPVDLSLSTLQKDNPLPWIRQWCHYWQLEGVDRVLLYDNGSLSYSITQLADALRPIDGLDIVVIDWNYPYGPTRAFDLGYAQAGSLNHARLFAHTNWSASFDIDEYPVRNSEANLAEYLALTPAWQAQVRIPPFMVPIVDERPDNIGDLTAADFLYRDRVPGRATKYFYRPKRVRWCATHRAEGPRGRSSTVEPAELAFLHYIGLTTNWKRSDARVAPTKYDPSRHEEDLRVKNVFERAAIR